MTGNIAFLIRLGLLALSGAAGGNAVSSLPFTYDLATDLVCASPDALAELSTSLGVTVTSLASWFGLHRFAKARDGVT